MLRSINTATTKRPAPMQAHRARGDQPQIMSQPDEYYRSDYIEFINRLMQRMKMDALNKMLDFAIDTLDNKEG